MNRLKLSKLSEFLSSSDCQADVVECPTAVCAESAARHSEMVQEIFLVVFSLNCGAKHG